jgi:hypothetical protein
MVNYFTSAPRALNVLYITYYLAYRARNKDVDSNVDLTQYVLLR